MTDPEEDNALVRRCQTGDREAFNELVTRYRSRVYAMIYNMVQNEQDAWDLAQDAFVKAWRSLDRFRFQSSFYTWLYRIATNIAIDALRKRRPEFTTEFDDSLAAEIEPGSSFSGKSDASPSKKIGQEELRARIDAAIDKLSPEHRAVILLKEIDGLHYQEISEVLGCSIGTVMSRLFYARKKLQTLLADLYEES